MNETIKTFLKNISLEDTGYEDDKYYVIDLDSYKEFNRVYNEVENQLNVERDPEESWLNEDEAHIQYEYEDIIIEIIALFEEDYYSLNIAEN